MTIDLSGQTVTGTDTGYTVALTTDHGFEIRIESDYEIITAHATSHHSPDPDDPCLAELTDLTGAVITDARIAGGLLVITFTSGIVLRVQPDDNFEAWKVTGPNGLLIVCTPGGELATWSDNATSQPGE